VRYGQTEFVKQGQLNKENKRARKNQGNKRAMVLHERSLVSAERDVFRRKIEKAWCFEGEVTREKAVFSRTIRWGEKGWKRIEKRQGGKGQGEERRVL